MIEAALGMLNNAALLMSLGVVYLLLPAPAPDGGRPYRATAGVVVGLLGIALMLTPWELVEGLFFDTRSVLLAVAGLYLGPLTTGIAVVMTGAYRVWQGGVGMPTGILVIVSSAGLGLLWRRYLPRRTGWLDFYLLGVLVHLAMLASMLAMPWERALETLRQISLPVLGIYPLATMLLAKLLAHQRSRRSVAEEAGHQARRLKGMLENAWGIVNLVDGEGRCAYVSDAVTPILGYSARELQGMPFEDLVHADDRDAARARFGELVSQSGGRASMEFRIRHRDGHWVWFEHVGVNLLADPDVQAVVVNSRDITEQRRADRELRAWQRLMEKVIQHDPIGIALLDKDLHFLFVSDRFCADYHVKREDTVGRHHYEVFPELPEKWRRAHQLALAGEVVEGHDDTFVRDDGVVETTRWQVRPWHDEDGLVGGIILYTEMTTERRRTEEAYGAVLQSSLEGFWVVDTQGTVLDANDTACRWLGYNKDELVGMSISGIDALEDARGVVSHIRRVMESGGDRFESVHRRKDGSLMDVEISITHLNLEGGRLFVFVRDITEHRAAEQALTKERTLLRKIMETSPVGVCLLDPGGSIVFANSFAEGLLGLSRSQITSRAYNAPSWRITSLEGDPFPNEELPFARVMSTGHPVFDVRHALEHPDGSRVLLSVNAAPVVGEGREITGVVAIMQDITERVNELEERARVESQLRQAQKMEAVGRLAGGIAHDFNNMLAVIMGAAEMAIPEVDPHSTVYQDLTHINQAAARSAELTRQLLAFSRKQVVRPRPTNLNRVVAGQEKILKRMIGEDVEIRLGLGAALWSVLIDPSQVDQILANLLVNARDAIEGTGTITVETDNVYLEEDHARFDMPIEAGEFVLLSVTDTGTGMDATTVEHIFEPFFTTKEAGAGTGLGLATVYGIVKQNNGVIHVYSEPGLGTTFKIYLPRHGDEAGAPEPEAERPLTGSETVLVVEDEEAILTLAGRFLEDCGYRVLTARTPMEALGAAHEHDGPIHLLLSDVVMPGMNGRQLQARVQELRPGIRTLFMSGYTADVIAHRGVLDPGVDFVQKPFTMRTLTRRVREVLDEPGRPGE